MLRCAALLAAISLSAPAFAGDGHGHGHDDDHAEEKHDDDGDHLAVKDGVRLLHAWTNATSHDHANVYVEIENDSDIDIALTGGASDIASSVVLMGAAIKAGGEGSVIPSIPIQSGSDFVLDPTGVYLHLDGIDMPLKEGGEFEMTITLDPIGEIEVHVEIEDADATNHSHAGHNH